MDLLFAGRSDSEQVFFNVYYIQKDFDIESLALQKDEVDFVEWMTLDRIKDLIDKGLFLKNHVEEVYRMIDIFKKRGIILK